MMNNPIIADIMRMKAQGMNPIAARQKLVQRYPKMRDMQPFMQGQTPQEMDQIAQTTAQSMGLDPKQMIASIQGLSRRR